MGEAMKVPSSRNRRSQIIKTIRTSIAVLFEIRVLIAEIMFTAAAAYACYLAYQVLVHKVL
jgi:hypothetical protein